MAKWPLESASWASGRSFVRWNVIAPYEFHASLRDQPEEFPTALGWGEATAQLRSLVTSLREFDVELGQLTAFYALAPDVVAALAKLSKDAPLLGPVTEGSAQLAFSHPELLAMRTSRALNTAHIEFGALSFSPHLPHFPRLTLNFRAILESRA